MALMLGKLDDALRTTGVPDDKAREAAEEVANDKKDLADLRSNVRVLKWITSTTLAGVVALVVGSFTELSRIRWGPAHLHLTPRRPCAT